MPAVTCEASRNGADEADIGSILKLLTFTTLYPNTEQPNHGVFVENRLRHLVASGRATSEVVAPVPWFPWRSRRFGTYGAFARVPASETRHGLLVRHPRYLVVPKVGMTAAPGLLALGALSALKAAGDVDVIDAHYFYPDGVAAALLGRRLGRPLVITARGSDLNLIPRHPLARRMICWAAAQADALITVSQALKDALTGLGVSAEKITVLRNGVDLNLFRPTLRDATRTRLGVAGPVLLSVGHLIRRKGHDLVIAALPHLAGHSLLIVGDGPERRALESLAASLGVADRVRFLGAILHDRLPEIYGAADALVLASSREGWPNVLLEAMACGTPAIAASVWGNPEVIAAPAAGLLMRERSAAGIANAVIQLSNAAPSRTETRRYAEAFSWEATTEGQLRLFNDVLSRRRQHRSAA